MSIHFGRLMIGISGLAVSFAAGDITATTSLPSETRVHSATELSELRLFLSFDVLVDESGATTNDTFRFSLVNTEREDTSSQIESSDSDLAEVEFDWSDFQLDPIEVFFDLNVLIEWSDPERELMIFPDHEESTGEHLFEPSLRSGVDTFGID